MAIKFANNGSSTLAGAISASATSLSLAPGDGSKFPTLAGGDFFMLTLIKLVGGSEVREIVKVTARSGDALTVVRGQEGTTATTFATGDRADNRLTAETLALFLMSGNDIVNSLLKGVGFAYADVGNANTINYLNGLHQRWAPNTGSQTLGITNWPAAGVHGELMIEGVNLGAATITWPTIQWMKSDGTFTTTFSNVGVTLQTSGIDFVVLWTRDGGTTIYGKVMR